MKKIILLLLLQLPFIIGRSQPLHEVANHPVIIDTDCAIDDMRAISMLLNQKNIFIQGILTSDGTLSPNEGRQKVLALLHSMGCDSIPVLAGEPIPSINPPWRKFNMQIEWGGTTADYTKPEGASEWLIKYLTNSDQQIDLVCLGPLTTIAKSIKAEPAIIKKIHRIIWYTESFIPLKGFNYECDKAAAESIINSKIRIDIISNLNRDLFFDENLLQQCKQSPTKLAKALYHVHKQPVVNERLKQNHFRLWDELVALYLLTPELYDMAPVLKQINVRFNQDYDIKSVKEAIEDIINGKFISGNGIVFTIFPDQRTLFKYDVRQIMDSVIIRYGSEEWKACVMTDEFHGHLGVYSIVGAKMGIKARELFGVGPDMLKALSFAGTRPPFSCMNDGIQVSTGATLGQGTISVSSDSITAPTAIFTYKGNSIKIKLKKEYASLVEKDIKDGLLKFGLLDDGYWKLVRRAALRYWLEWDRNKIFDIESVTR